MHRHILLPDDCNIIKDNKPSRSVRLKAPGCSITSILDWNIRGPLMAASCIPRGFAVYRRLLTESAPNELISCSSSYRAPKGGRGRGGQVHPGVRAARSGPESGSPIPSPTPTRPVRPQVAQRSFAKRLFYARPVLLLPANRRRRPATARTFQAVTLNMLQVTV